MNGVPGLADRKRVERVEPEAVEALTTLSDGHRTKPLVLGHTVMSTQHPPDLVQGRFARMQEDLQQRPGFAQSSEFQGVWYNRKSGRWQASIGALGRTFSLGSFDCEEDAARMYDRAVLRVRGSNAALNFPPTDYQLPDGSLALDLQVEAALMEAFLDRGSGNEPGGHSPLRSQPTDDAGDGAPVLAAAMGDLVRQCLGRINSADRVDLQEASDALGPGYLRLMELITGAGRVLAAANSAPSSGGRHPAAPTQPGGTDGGGESADVDRVGEGAGEGAWGTLEHPDPHRRSSSNPQQQLQQIQQAGSWHGARAGPGPAAGGGAPVEYGRTSLKVPQPQQASATQPSQQARQQRQPPQVRVVSNVAGAGTAPAADSPTHRGRERSMAERPRATAGQPEAGAGGGGGAAGGASISADSDAPGGPPAAPSGAAAAAAAAVDRKPLSVSQGPSTETRPAGASQPPAQPSSGTTNLSANIMQELCNHLASHIHQARQQQLKQQEIAEGAGRPAPRPPPPVVHAVAQLASQRFPLMLLLQAASQLTVKKIVSREDYEALEAVVAATERASIPAARTAATDGTGPMGHLQRGGSQPQHQLEQHVRDVATESASGPAGGGAGAAVPTSGLVRGGSGIGIGGGGPGITGIKRKSSDVAAGPSEAAAAAGGGGTGGVRAEPLAAGALTTAPGGPIAPAAGMYNIEDVASGQPASKRQHRARVPSPSPLPASAVPPVTSGAAPGVMARAAVRDVVMMDPSTSVAMAAAAAAASTAGGVPIGIPTAPQEQARAAAAVAAAAAALTAPGLRQLPPQAIMAMAAAGAAPKAVAPTHLHSAGAFGRGQVVDASAAATGTGDTAPARQHIGLGRRLFNAISSHLPPGAELDCLLPPRHGFLGVLYSQPGSARVGAALWDGAEVRDLGEYSSERDARQSVESAARLLVGALGGGPAAAAAAAAQAAPSAARHGPSSGPAISGGILTSKPSVITSGTTGPPLLGMGSNPETPAGEAGAGSGANAAAVAAAATAAARRMMAQAQYHGGEMYKSGGGGSGSNGSAAGGMPMMRSGAAAGGHAVVIRPLGGPTGGLPTAPSTRSLTWGTFSPAPSHGAGAGAGPAVANAVHGSTGGGAAGGGGTGKIASGGRASSRPQAAGAAAAAAIGGEPLETVGSSLPKGPVMGPYLVGNPEVAPDGSLQLVCQIVVQQDEPLSSDDLNNVITQTFNATQLQSLINSAGAGQTMAAVLAAAAAGGSGAAADAGGPVVAGPGLAPTITTALTGTTCALAGEAPVDESHRRSLHHQPPPPQQHHPRQQQAPAPAGAGAAAVAPPVQHRVPYTAGRPVAAPPAPPAPGSTPPAEPPGPPPMPFALPPAPSVLQNLLLHRERDLDLDGEYDPPRLNDAASVQGPLLRPAHSQLAPSPSPAPQAQQQQQHQQQQSTAPPPSQPAQQQQLPSRTIPQTIDHRPLPSAGGATTAGRGSAAGTGSHLPLPQQHPQRPRPPQSQSQPQQPPAPRTAQGSPTPNVDLERAHHASQPPERSSAQEALPPRPGPPRAAGPSWPARQGSGNGNWAQGAAATASAQPDSKVPPPQQQQQQPKGAGSRPTQDTVAVNDPPMRATTAAAAAATKLATPEGPAAVKYGEPKDAPASRRMAGDPREKDARGAHWGGIAAEGSEGMQPADETAVGEAAPEAGGEGGSKSSMDEGEAEGGDGGQRWKVQTGSAGKACGDAGKADEPAGGDGGRGAAEAGGTKEAADQHCHADKALAEGRGGSALSAAADGGSGGGGGGGVAAAVDRMEVEG